ncbi:adenylate/guanylate cyclase domain-containing protein [Nocardioides pocheonensis]|jgi:adenylate cyclase|uniref:Adenylate/guanylate cyclase domain-containing protein n=1 Tax=Nocardioides pocheonensis TaxID=661485 RepID=A0A3N0GM73_9ACTN|nr:adenylate/guanylate cyclase domain-containing protein [Nocardioides pocheonensis]RNM13557.1 adenylate/guanylate cyclase domain-containing protein [Nocardioides pocheonensis]
MTGPDPTEVPEPGGPTGADLERAILGETPTLSGSDIAAAAGVSLADARRLWRALGFPDAANQNAFTTADRDALILVAEAVAETGIDFETMLRLTRAVGQTVARLADWEVATISSAVDEFAARDGASADMMKATVRLVEELSARFDRLLVYSWRRHLAAAIGRIEAFAATDDETVTEATVGFADLVAFTALSNELGEDELGDLVEIFETRCSDVIADHNGRVIKTLGDSVLFLELDPVQAIDIALDIIAVVGRDERLPDVRLGLATGPVVLRMGDVYGPPVNLAARFTAVARRNRVIIDERTAELLPVVDFETRKLPARPLRGFGDVEPVTVRRTRPRH